jgi:hypothetical protein
MTFAGLIVVATREVRRKQIDNRQKTSEEPLNQPSLRRMGS